MSGTQTKLGTSEKPASDASLSLYEGEWVVLHENAVIEHGPDLVEIAARARTRGILCPRVLFVEPRRQDEVKLGL